MDRQAGMVTRACNPNSWKEEAGEWLQDWEQFRPYSDFWISLGYSVKSWLNVWKKVGLVRWEEKQTQWPKPHTRLQEDPELSLLSRLRTTWSRASLYSINSGVLCYIAVTGAFTGYTLTLRSPPVELSQNIYLNFLYFLRFDCIKSHHWSRAQLVGCLLSIQETLGLIPDHCLWWRSPAISVLRRIRSSRSALARQRFQGQPNDRRLTSTGKRMKVNLFLLPCTKLQLQMDQQFQC